MNEESKGYLSYEAEREYNLWIEALEAKGILEVNHD